jgi:hypothetical protein
VYFKDEDVFLDLIVRPRQQQDGVDVEGARILAKGQFFPHDNITHVNSETKESTAVKNAVQKFVMCLLQWLWNDCEGKFDC